MTQLKDYYERYWTRDTDVSDADCTTPERRGRLLATLREFVAPGEAVLDLGCGAGAFTAWMKKAGYRAIGADLSTHALAMARDRFPQCGFLDLDPGGAIPAADGAFAAVWASEVIEHVLEVPAFLGEVRRVLRPGGLLILTTPYHGTVKNVLLALTRFEKHFNPLGSHIRFFDKPGLRKCLAAAGLDAIRWGGIGRCWPLYRTWFVVARRREAGGQ